MAKFTKKAIMDCFLNMLKHNNIDRITVMDICEQCGINRNTFFYSIKHFSESFDATIDTMINLCEANN